MRSKIRVYMEEQIKDLFLNPQNPLITIGSADLDTLTVNCADVLPNHLSFEYINGIWICHDKGKNKKNAVKGKD